MIFAVIAVLLFTSSVASSAYATSTQVAFNPIINLSDNSGESTIPAVASVGTHVYVAWIDSSFGSRPQVVFRASSDGGANWSPVLTAPFQNLGGPARVVQMYATGAYVFLAWVQKGNIAFAASSNNGASFDVHANLGYAGTEPAVRASLPYVYLDWNLPGQNGINFIASNDNGSSFGAATLIGTQPGDHEAALAVAGDSDVYAVWVGAQTSGQGVYVAVSHDNGGTFTTTQLNLGFLNRSREPMIAASGSDVYVTWTSNNNAFYSSYVSVSTNSGDSFTSPLDLSGSSLNAREVQVAASGSNAYVTFRATTIVQTGVKGTNQYICVTSNDGTNWNCPPPLNLSPAQSGSEKGFGGVAVDGSSVYVLWPQPPTTMGVAQMFFDASQDDGNTWGGAQQVSSSATGVVGMNDPGAQGPLVAASNGHVYVVWKDTSTGNGDIYFRASTP